MKFAYLIMAHHKFDVLKLLLQDLDDERNDIFLHVDKKTKDFDATEFTKLVRKSRLIVVDRIPVFWGHSSQIKCELNLLKKATEYGPYDYYHLLVGVEFPLKSQNYIHDFFEKNHDFEFIGYDNMDCRFEQRMKYFYFFKKYARCKNTWKKQLESIGDKLLKVQRKIGINRISGQEGEYKKGYANWSITHDLACYIISKEKEIEKKYRYTFCADEIFIHTLVYHSEYYDKVYDKEDEYHSAMRFTTWEDAHNQIHKENLPMLLQLDRLFARKFDDEHATEIIKEIIKSR